MSSSETHPHLPSTDSSTNAAGIVAWFARNGVAANLLMFGIIVGGLMTIPTIKQEVFPEMASERIMISVVYPGAAPTEVEEGIVSRIEEAVEGLEDIKRVTATATENVGTVLVELLAGSNVSKAMDDIKSRVDAIDTFPTEAEEPEFKEIIFTRQVINVAVSGKTDELTLKRIGEQVRDELLALDSITQVTLGNVRPYEISIELSEDALRRYGLTFDEVALAVRSSSLDLPGGSIKTSGGEILLRTKGQAYRGAEFESIVLRTGADGSRLLLGDVARVVDGFEETDLYSSFNGEPSVLLAVFRVGDQSALTITKAVRDYIAAAQPKMPPGISLTPWQDESLVLRGRLEMLIRNGWQGLVLVFLILALFMQLRLAFWVCLGIPTSFLGTFLVLPHLDVSVNMISLFAFILVLGIVVDDAIVVGENVFTHREEGDEGLKASTQGAQQVSVPVVFAVLTTVAAFLPMAFVPGPVGKIWAQIPAVVITTILFSLVESLLILPAHLVHLKVSKERPRFPFVLWFWFQGVFINGLDWFILTIYRPALELSLQFRYATVALGLASLFATFGLVSGGFVKFVYLPPIDDDIISARVTMPLGTNIAKTTEAVRQMEQAAFDIIREYDGEQDSPATGYFRNVMTSVGSQPRREEQSQQGGGIGASFRGSHYGEITIEMAPSEERTADPKTAVTSKMISEKWRELVGTIPDAVEVSFASNLFSAGDAINIQLEGANLEQLQAAATDLKQRITELPGVEDVTDSYRVGKEELKLNIRPEAQTYGLTLADLARQVRQAFYGEEVQRVQRGRDDVKVMLRYPEQERTSLRTIEAMHIRTRDGREVPFSTVAEVQAGRGYAAIQRSARKRSINITAGVDPAKGNPTEINQAIQQSFLPDILTTYDGVQFSLEGEQKEQKDTLDSLGRGFLMALLAIYALLAIPFKSYWQPFIVMSAIPFGLVGAILGHLIMGHYLSILSICGIVALAGVAVNDSLVMVDYINGQRNSGNSLLKAIHDSGIARFRPILLTSLTTFGGLTPLLLERSVQAQFLIPMAVSLAFGILFSTVITLFIVPCLYLILEDGVMGVRWAGALWKWLLTGEFQRPAPLEGV